MSGETWAPYPGTDPEFDETWEKILETLESAGERLDLAELEARRNITAAAMSKYSGKTYGGMILDKSNSVVLDYDEAPETALLIPPKPTAPYWYDDPKDVTVLDHYILARRALGRDMLGALLITGEAGYGKTISVAKAVERLNAQAADRAHEATTEVPEDIRLFVMDCATVTDPGKWFGRREVDKAGTRYIKSDLVVAIESGAVVLFDEIGRLHPHLHSPVMSLFSNTESVTLSDLNVTIQRDPKTVFIGTTNEGSQYGGIHRMDWAMRERFSTTLRRTPPPADEETRILTSATNCDEDAASVLVTIARKTRDMHEAGELRNAISTRTLVAAAMWVGFGMNEWDALDITAVQEFDGDASGMVGTESDRQKVLGIMEGRLRRARKH